MSDILKMGLKVCKEGSEEIEVWNEMSVLWERYDLYKR